MESIAPNYSYPLNNYNYNYKNYIDKNYSLEAKGISNQPTFGTFRHNVKKLVDYGDALMLDPIPASNSIAGITDIDPNDKKAVSQAQLGFQQGQPYSKFRQEYPEKYYPTNGIYSSSYFVQSGFCPVQSAKTEAQCKSRDPNYIWMNNTVKLPNVVSNFLKQKNNPLTNNNQTDRQSIENNSGTCYKPRYSYINNANDSNVFQGLVPGIMNDIIDLNPATFLRTMDGNPVPGSSMDSPPRFELLPCISETFQNKNISDKNIKMEKNNQEDFYGWWHPYGRWGPWGPWGPRPYRRWWMDRPVRLAYPLGPAVYVAEGFENSQENSINKLLAVLVLIIIAFYLLRR